MALPQKISVLFICQGPFGYKGRAASYMFPKVLAENGHTVNIISFTFMQGYSSTDIVFDQNDDDKFSIEEYTTPSFSQRLRVVRDCIVKHRPDIVHTYEMPYYFLLPIICKLSGILAPKWLIDIRSPPLNTPRSFYKRIIKQIRFLHQTGFDAIISPASESARSHFLKLFKPFYEVPFGVDVSLAKPKVWDKKGCQQKIKFVYIGSISRKRRLETLVTAINLVKKKYPYQFQVDFFGSGDFFETMKDNIRNMKLADVINLRGVVAHAQLLEKLCEYDVGIGYVPYEKYMVSPALKVLEYMAANLLVIASDTDGIKQQVIHNSNGLLFKNTPESIFKTMAGVIENGCPPEIMTAGYEYAQKNSWAAIVKDKLLPVYTKLLQYT